MENLKAMKLDEYNELVNLFKDQYPLATACDQRGEQTINRDAKTEGILLLKQ